MAILTVYKYPHPVLREPCQPIAQVDECTQQLIEDMVETLYSFPGAVGLAAPQVGAPVRLFITDTTAATSKDNLKVLVNPEIVQKSRNKLVREGCLSFPEYLANIKRALRVTVQCLDQHGTPQEYTVEGLEAIAIQHELDHLDGVLLIDRVQSLKTDLIRRQPLPSKNS
jgi:peptide deformylase